MPTYPLDTLGPTIDENGISAPPYSDIYQSLIQSYKDIYGSDIYLSGDSQDGQQIAILAKAIDDNNKAAIMNFNSYSPTYAFGKGLSATVKINNIHRLEASKSSAVVVLTGQVGTTITNGIVSDTSGNKWDLPSEVIIPVDGTATVTVTAQEEGSISVPAGAINEISTPQKGWQQVTNPAASVAGDPIETDPQLKARREDSTALSSTTIMEGIAGALRNLTGVVAVRGYENDSGSTDSNGIPAGNIAFVVLGGDAQEIAQTIAIKKTLGAPTYGSTTVEVIDNHGEPNDIHYSVPDAKRLSIAISLRGFTGYTTIIGNQIKQAVADYINTTIGIGMKVYLPRLQVPAQLYGAPESLTYEIVEIKGSIYPATPGTSDIAMAFDEIPTCQVSDVSITTVI